MESSKRPSKYHLSINFLAEKKTVFPITEKFKTKPFQQSVNIIFPSTFWLRNTIFFTSKNFKKRTFQLSVNMIFHAEENITLSLFFFVFFFYVELTHPPPHFLGYLSLVNTMERYCTNLLRWKIFFLFPEIHNINFSFILKFINSSFLLNMNFPFVQSSCFYNNFFLS